MKNITKITDLQNQAKLKQLDDLELIEMIKLSFRQKATNKILSHDEVKKRKRDTE